MSDTKDKKINIDKVNKLVEKYDSLKKDNKLDLSADEDLSIAVMNLISMEEHLFFTGAKTGNDFYYTVLDEVRKMRVELMKKMIKEYGGEVWCISKHILGASYRMMEYGTKHLSRGNDKLAKEMFEKAYAMYSLFWALNSNIIKPEDLK